MDDAIPVFRQAQRTQVIVNDTGVDHVHAPPQRLPNVNLVIEFRVGTSVTGRMPDDNDFCHGEEVNGGKWLFSNGPGAPQNRP
jgi:hypothetical protein